MTADAQRTSNDLVPLTERLLYLRVLRAVLAAATVLDAALLPHMLREPFIEVSSVALGYVLVCLVVEGLWRVMNRRGLWLFGSLLIVDGIYLGYATYLLGGASGPVRYLVLVHLAAVILLASYRTGLKVALWHSLVQLTIFYLQRAALGLHPFASSQARDDEWYRLVAFVLALWALGLTIASLAAVNERELRRRRYEMEQLAQMGQMLEDANDPLSVGDVLLDSLNDTFGFRRMALFEVAGDSPRLLTCRGLLDAVVEDFRLGQGSVLALAHDERKTLLVSEIDERVDPWLSAIMPDARNITLVPLVADGVVGVLVAETGQPAGGRIERRIIATMERFAGHAALTMRNANLLARVQQMAVTDGLTQLANRRSFDRSLERELGRATRTDGRLSVVLLDIDHFKRLNDTHGHVVGDAVLRQVAEALRECGREYDTVARYGGEEFAAVLPGCSSGLALQVAERLRSAIESAPTDVPVTASAGVATYPYDGVDADGLLSAADQALYASKRAGRNQIRSAEQARSSEQPVTAAG
jgi:diguanylate cyclase (GGDEF)-like protein